MPVKITLIGKVHDDSYRLFLLEEADYLFIPNFDARNVRLNGKEALVVLIDGERGQIEEFIEFVKTNKPEKAIVEEIKIEEFEGRVRDIERFRASFNTAQLSKIVQVGLKMLEKQDLTIGKIDSLGERLEKKIDSLGDRLEKKIDLLGDRLERKFDEKIDALGDRFEKKIDSLGDRLETKIDESTQRIEQKISESAQRLEHKMEESTQRLENKMPRYDMREFMETRLKDLQSELTEIKSALKKAGIL